MEAREAIGGARQALKEAAGAWHQRLEDGLALERRVRTRADLVPLFTRLLPLHQAIEGAWQTPPAGLAAWPAAWDLGARRKSPRLFADLLALGLSQRAIAALPPVPPAAAWRTLFGMAGCLWVVEGSTLGGLHLARSLGRTVGLRPDNGGSFFAAYGRRTKAMWRAWLAALEDVLPTPQARQEAGAAAAGTFALFYDQLVPAAAGPWVEPTR